MQGIMLEKIDITTYENEGKAAQAKAVGEANFQLLDRQAELLPGC